MRKSSSGISSRTFVLVFLLSLLLSGGMIAQTPVALPKVKPTSSSAGKPATTPHHRKKMKAGKAIIHHSDDDKKLQDIKAAKNKEKSSK